MVFIQGVDETFSFGIEKCIGLLITNFQKTFVLGRQLLDGVLVANEVVDYTS